MTFDTTINDSRYTYLLDGTLSLEEDVSTEQLCEYTANGPDVNGRGVVPCPHQDLGGAVVLGHHLLGHVTVFVWLLDPRQAEVADL